MLIKKFSKNEMAIARKHKDYSVTDIVELALKYKKLYSYQYSTKDGNVDCLYILPSVASDIILDSKEYENVIIENKRLIKKFKNMFKSNNNEEIIDNYLNGYFKNNIELYLNKQQEALNEFKDYCYFIFDCINSFNNNEQVINPYKLGISILYGDRCTSYKNGSITTEGRSQIFTVDNADLNDLVDVRTNLNNELICISIKRDLSLRSCSYAFEYFVENSDVSVNELLNDWTQQADNISGVEVLTLENYGNKTVLFNQELDLKSIEIPVYFKLMFYIKDSNNEIIIQPSLCDEID